MCFHLYLASPLTLSEVRSMVPEALVIDLLEPAEQRAFKKIHPAAQTAARLLHGACSCDLVVQRHPVQREDEAWLRRRYRQLGLSRAATIVALERHRRVAEEQRRPDDHWPRVVAGFVVEHARNAGDTLYFLHFSHDGLLGGPIGEAPERLSTATVRGAPGVWLPEDRLVMVHP